MRGPYADRPDLPLCQGVGDDRHLRAVCETCGGWSVLDPAPWLAQRLGGQRMESFEERLRCACGGRRAHLQVWPGKAEGRRGTETIFIWR